MDLLSIAGSLDEGKPIDSVSGKPISEKGMVSRVVKDLVGPFEGFNHVVYMDNFFTSGPLVEDLAKNKIYKAGTIRQTSKGFPENLRGLKLSKGSERCATMFLRIAEQFLLLAMSSQM